MVSALSRFTGGYSTVPPKSVSSIVPFEPIICPSEAFSFQHHEHPPKVTIHMKHYGRGHGPAPGIPALPPEMLPHMNWQAEDKLASWTSFQQRLTQYFTIAHTPKEDRVMHILFFGGQEAY